VPRENLEHGDRAVTFGQTLGKEPGELFGRHHCADHHADIDKRVEPAAVPVQKAAECRKLGSDSGRVGLRATVLSGK